MLYLRQRALKHLERVYPFTLADFDMRDEQSTFTDINPAFFITIARELDLLWLLPAMLYKTCSRPFLEIVSGFEWNGKLIQIAPVDRDACLCAIMDLTRRWSDVVLGFLKQEKIWGCESQEECMQTRFIYLGDHCFSAVDPLRTKFDIQFDDYDDSVCSRCAEEAKEDYSTEREKLWDDLPKLYFGLPPWEQLMEMRREAFKA